MIKPTVGRVLWYWPLPDMEQPHAATVAYVHNDNVVNLACVDESGIPYNINHVQILQDSEVAPESHYAEWMPYQKEQAAKDNYDNPIP